MAYKCENLITMSSLTPEEDWEVKKLRDNGGKAILTIPKKWWQMPLEEVLSIPVNMHYKDGRLFVEIDFRKRMKDIMKVER